MTALAHSLKNHITPFRIYYGVAGALLLLTLLTVYVAGVDFGPWNMVVAMGIAIVKASLVCLFFMHLLYDNKLYAITFMAAILFLGIFVIFTMFDALSRDALYDIRAQSVTEHAAALYDDGGKLLEGGENHLPEPTNDTAHDIVEDDSPAEAGQ